MPVRCFLIRLHSAVCLLICMLLSSLSAEAAGPPHPEKDPAVQKAKTAYNAKKKQAMEAQRAVSKLRAELSRIHARQRLQSVRYQRAGGNAAPAPKTAEQSEAEAGLAKAQASLSKLLDRLHKMYQNEKGMAQRKQLNLLKEQLEEAKTDFEPDFLLINKLTKDIRRASKDLEKLEAALFSEEEAYLEAKRVVASAIKKIEMAKSKNRGRVQPVTEQYVAPNSDMIMIKENIQQAVEAYAAADQERNAAKKALSRQLHASTKKYNDYLYQQAKKKQEEQRKKAQNQKKKRR